MKNEINVGHYRVSVDTTGNEDNMIEKIKALWIKYEEIIAYLIVGGLTTVVSWAAKFLANFLLFDNTMYPTPFQNVVLSIINWTAGVILHISRTVSSYSRATHRCFRRLRNSSFPEYLP